MSKEFNLTKSIKRADITKVKMHDLGSLVFDEDGKLIEGYMSVLVGEERKNLRLTEEHLPDITLDVAAIIQAAEDQLK